MQLETIIGGYMKKVPRISKMCERCLQVERYDGNVVLMLIDASFVSLGMNYFTVVVPKVFDFKEKFVDTNKIASLKDLANYGTAELTELWKNKRSWNVAKEVADHLSSLDEDDRNALIKWAQQSRLDNWKSDPVGRINGVGVNTYQYLRMMGGVDTVMPDKIVKRVFQEILEKSGSGEEIPQDDLRFVKKVEEIGERTGYRPIELCWMTWLVQYDDQKLSLREYSELMSKI